MIARYQKRISIPTPRQAMDRIDIHGGGSEVSRARWTTMTTIGQRWATRMQIRRRNMIRPMPPALQERAGLTAA